jgi:hypothetical protein
MTKARLSLCAKNGTLFIQLIHKKRRIHSLKLNDYATTKRGLMSQIVCLHRITNLDHRHELDCDFGCKEDK